MSIKNYVIGFILSLGFTFAAFWLVGQQPFSREVLFILLIALALLQLVVQLVCFLHVGREKSHWNVVALAFAIFVVAVVAGGSLWIMGHLEHQMHDTSEIW